MTIVGNLHGLGVKWTHIICRGHKSGYWLYQKVQDLRPPSGWITIWMEQSNFSVELCKMDGELWVKFIMRYLKFQGLKFQTTLIAKLQVSRITFELKSNHQSFRYPEYHNFHDFQIVKKDHTIVTLQLHLMDQLFCEDIAATLYVRPQHFYLEWPKNQKRCLILLHAEVHYQATDSQNCKNFIP